MKKSLHLVSLHSRSFRNLTRLDVDLHPRFNLFVGDNAQGKTNLIEAAYYLLTLRPLRPVRPRELIAWEEKEARLCAEIMEGGPRTLEVRLRKKSRSLQVNGASPLELDDYFGEARVVAFTPEDIQLIRGSPDLRRRFLDRAVFNTHVGYLQEVREYLKILQHRNSLLKKDSSDEGLLDVFTLQLQQRGARLLRRRLQLLERLRHHLKEAFARIFPSVEDEVEAEYLSSLGELPLLSNEESEAHWETRLSEHFAEATIRQRGRERERGLTLVGPHLDDLGLTLQGRSFKQAASQGQTRAMVLALKIAEFSEILERTGDRPLLLLDDVASELDPRHTEFLFAFLEERGGQVLLTTTHLEEVKLQSLQQYPSFVLEAGQIHKEVPMP